MTRIARYLSSLHSTIRSMALNQRFIDISPPRYTGPLEPLDKTTFNKSIPVLAATIDPKKVNAIIQSRALKNFVLNIPKISAVARHETDSSIRQVLLNVTDISQLSPEAKEVLDAESLRYEQSSVDLDYSYWTASEIIQSILPNELREGAPVGFATIGHIAHLNLNAEYLPYKHIIGQIFLDKLPTIRTVVNKVDSIQNKFRVFQMELLAGDADYEVVHSESNCLFTFDFSKVYWNSRLQHEHARMVSKISPQDILADVFAGVGPFALPIAKNGCGVFANDLNPSSFEYLVKNTSNNSVNDVVRTSCEDGRDFIRNVVDRAISMPFPAYTGPRLSKSKLLKLQKQNQQMSSSGQDAETPQAPRSKITQFVMNLPDSAIEFLDAFRGVLSSRHSEIYNTMPTIHCYCFTRESEYDSAAVDIRKRVEERLGGSIADDYELHHVRSVAPGKEMFCISFELPIDVAYDK